MWYLWVGWHIPPGSRPLVFIQKAVLAGTVSPEMKYSSLNIEGTEAQCLKECQKCSGLPVGTAQRITPLHSLSLFNVVLFKCFGSVILFRIFSPCATPLGCPFLVYLHSREKHLSSGMYPWIPKHFSSNQAIFREQLAVHGGHPSPGLPGTTLGMGWHTCADLLVKAPTEPCCSP